MIQLKAVASQGGDVYANASFPLSVLSLSVPPPSPKLSSIYLSNDGRSTIINFDTKTNQGSSTLTLFPCSKVVVFPGSTEASCKWQSPQQLIALHAANPITYTNVGDVLRIVNNVIRGECLPLTKVACEQYPAASNLKATILAPRNPIVPVPVLSTASTIGACDSINIDPSLTSGDLGRPWVAIRWTAWDITGLDMSTPGLNITKHINVNLTNYMNTQFHDLTRSLQVPNKYFDVGRYQVRLTVTNCFSQTATTTTVIEVSPKTMIPIVSIAGPSSIVVYRNSSLNLFASIQSSAPCPGRPPQDTELVYSWNVFIDNTHLPDLMSQSRDRRAFKLAPYSLEPNSRYAVQVVVKGRTGSGYFLRMATSQVFVQVGVGDAVAVIAGGQSQTFSVSDTVRIDGSLSYDSDNPSLQSRLLYFRWTCMKYSPNYGATCNTLPSVVTNAADYMIPSNTLKPGTYKLILQVSKGVSFNSSTSTSVLVTLVSSPVPKVSFSSIQTKYDPSRKLVLSTSIEATDTVTAAWSSSTVKLETGSYTRTPTNTTFPSGVYSFQLSIGANTLTAGLSYTFTVSAAYISVNPKERPAVSASTVTITMNSPPFGGSLDISPKSNLTPYGTALNTSFSLRTFQWTDDVEDYPMLYAFSYYILSSDTPISVRTFGPTPYVNTVLGQGLATFDYNVWVVAFAADVYGTAANTTTTVKVLPLPSADTVNLVATVSSKLATAFNNTDASAMTAIVGAVTTALNTIDCKTPVKCSTLNRLECLSTANTCGPCNSGSIGIDGDANTKCALPSALRQVGQSCKVNDNCISGNCIQNVCYNAIKKCAGQDMGPAAVCSGHGTCQYEDTNGNRLKVCYEGDDSCRAICSCQTSPPRYGRDCSLTAAQVIQYRSIRETLCEKYSQALDLQDVSVEVVRSRAITITDILTDLSQVTDEGLELCATALISTIRSNPAVVSDDAVYSPLSKALSNVAAKGSDLPSLLFDSVNDAILSLSLSIQSSLAIGETPSEIITSNFRMLSSVVGLSSLAAQTFTSPQSNYAKFQSLPAPSVRLQVTEGEPGALGVTVLQYTNNPEGVSSKSSMIGVLLTSYLQSATGSRRRLATLPSLVLTIVLQNNAPITYKSLASSKQKINCNANSYNVTGKCPDGKVYEVSCHGKKGVFNINCSGHTDRPVCTTFDGSKYSVNRGCTVHSYTKYNTTCVCSGSSSSSSSGLAVGHFVEYSSAVVVDSTPFSIRWVQST